MRLTVSVCALALVMSATTALALDASVKCAASKIGVAGKYEFCRMKAAAKAFKAGGTPDYSKCDAAFSAKWAAVEAKAGGDCPSMMDDTTQKSELTGNAGRSISELTGGARFVDNADGTITDTQSGLTWEKKIKLDGSTDNANLHDANDVYEWAGTCSSNASKYCQPTGAASAACTAGVEGNVAGCAQCTGGDGTCTIAMGAPGATVWTWIVALNAATLGAHSDWRLPTRAELEGIVDYADTSFPAVDAAFHGATCGGGCTDATQATCSCTSSAGHWSASTTATSTGNAWTVSFGNGYTFPNSKATPYNVRAVR